MRCRPLLHAMLAAGLTSSYGVEIDAIKCQKAAAFLAQTRTELTRRGAMPPWFTAVARSQLQRHRAGEQCCSSLLLLGLRPRPRHGVLLSSSLLTEQVA